MPVRPETGWPRYHSVQKDRCDIRCSAILPYLFIRVRRLLQGQADATSETELNKRHSLLAIEGHEFTRLLRARKRAQKQLLSCGAAENDGHLMRLPISYLEVPESGLSGLLPAPQRAAKNLGRSGTAFPIKKGQQILGPRTSVKAIPEASWSVHGY